MTDPAPQPAPNPAALPAPAPAEAPGVTMAVHISVNHLEGDLLDHFDPESVKAHLSPAAHALMAANGVTLADADYHVLLAEGRNETYMELYKDRARFQGDLHLKQAELDGARDRIRVLEHVLITMRRDPELGGLLARLAGV